MEDEVLQRFRDTTDGALLGRDFLEKYKGEYPWKVGQTYKLRELGNMSITFVGAFDSDNEVYNTIILADRRYLEEVDKRLGEASQVYVKIEDPADAPFVSAAIDELIPQKFPVKTKTKDQRAFMSNAVEDLREIVRLSHVVMAITLLVVLVSVANTISMATRDRTQEFGVIRSLGFQRSHVLGLVMGESLLLALVGGVLGLGAAVLIMNARDLYLGVTGMNLKIALSPDVAVLALVLSLLVGVMGGLLPALGASRLKIVDSLRNVD